MLGNLCLWILRCLNKGMPEHSFFRKLVQFQMIETYTYWSQFYYSSFPQGPASSAVEGCQGQYLHCSSGIASRSWRGCHSFSHHFCIQSWKKGDRLSKLSIYKTQIVWVLSKDTKSVSELALSNRVSLLVIGKNLIILPALTVRKAWKVGKCLWETLWCWPCSSEML